MTNDADRSAADLQRRLFDSAAEQASAFDPARHWDAQDRTATRRRSFLALALASGAASLGGRAFAQGRVPFRLDEINAVHYLATTFIQRQSVAPPQS